TALVCRRRFDIGCVIVRDGKVFAARRHKVSEHHDAVAHAEIEAIRAAGDCFENGELRIHFSQTSSVSRHATGDVQYRRTSEGDRIYEEMARANRIPK